MFLVTFLRILWLNFFNSSSWRISDPQFYGSETSWWMTRNYRHPEWNEGSMIYWIKELVNCLINTFQTLNSNLVYFFVLDLSIFFLIFLIIMLSFIFLHIIHGYKWWCYNWWWIKVRWGEIYTSRKTSFQNNTWSICKKFRLRSIEKMNCIQIILFFLIYSWKI